ncbi:tonB-dependent Receptor Plug domain protein [Janthinobacterium agaricidamnosum NBRC 102515 = DSM 9628]|uniref:TonB-dependent Receptor Plug domain protein n=1 Tax=Janthinobacterium agaricidamnosum NBRC 102515 = DSM 9628 TaxID=1349767 RepID=W0V402_9BURK|nr:tonB-dependent Receptor Plug domain protein [Janthinobacterium agaricidamnosum NBRC 102515 = DSM 9628]
MHHRYLPFQLTLAGAVLLTAPAQAQQVQQARPAAPADQEIKAEPSAHEKTPEPAVQSVEVKGALASYDPRRDDTASKIVVNSEEIQKYGDTSIMDVFKRLPGITVSGAAGRSGGEVRMRGLGSGYTQILLNGERAPAGFSLDSLSPDVIERIEILRAASAEFSTQSIAGTINVVLKKAVKTAQRELKASVADGRNGASGSLSLQLSDRHGDFSYSMSGSYYNGNYRYDAPYDENGLDALGTPNLLRYNQGYSSGRYEGVNLAPRLNWTLKGGDTLTAQFFINAGRSGNDSVSEADTVLGLRPVYDVSVNNFTSHNAFGRGDLTWVHKMAAGAKLELKVGVNGDRNTSDNRQTGASQGAGLLLNSSVATVGSGRGVSSTGKYSTPLFDGHALSAGWDGAYGTRDDERRQRDVDLPGSHPVNSDEGFDAAISRLAVYGQDEWTINQRWSLYAGLRWEGVQTRSAGDTFEAVSQRSSVWSPLLQTLWKLPDSKGDQLRFALTRTYKAPSASNLIPRRFTSTNNSQTDPDRQGNPELKPELALGLDASFDHYWAEGALLSASASMRRIDGYTRQGLLLLDQRWVSTPVNDGRATTRSIELEAKFPLRTVMHHAPAIDLRASLSRNWSRVEAVPGPDNRLDQQTPFSGNLGIDYKSAGGSLSAGASFSYRNGGAVRITENQRSWSTPRRDLEVYGVWKFDPKNQLRIAVSNLLAQDYASDSSYTDASGTLRRHSVSPGSAQVRATMEMKF